MGIFIQKPVTTNEINYRIDLIILAEELSNSRTDEKLAAYNAKLAQWTGLFRIRISNE